MSTPPSSVVISNPLVKLETANASISESDDSLRTKVITLPSTKPISSTKKLLMVAGITAGAALALFGIIGLLSSYHALTLPPMFEWLQTAITWISTPPHYVALWLFSATGTIFVAGITIYWKKVSTPSLPLPTPGAPSPYNQEPIPPPTPATTVRDHTLEEIIDAYGFTESQFIRHGTPPFVKKGEESYPRAELNRVISTHFLDRLPCGEYTIIKDPAKLASCFSLIFVGKDKEGEIWGASSTGANNCAALSHMLATHCGYNLRTYDHTTNPLTTEERRWLLPARYKLNQTISVQQVDHTHNLQEQFQFLCCGSTTIDKVEGITTIVGRDKDGTLWFLQPEQGSLDQEKAQKNMLSDLTTFYSYTNISQLYTNDPKEVDPTEDIHYLYEP